MYRKVIEIAKYLAQHPLLLLQGCIAEIRLTPLAEVPEHGIRGKSSLRLRDHEEAEDLWYATWCCGEGADAMEVV